MQAGAVWTIRRVDLERFANVEIYLKCHTHLCNDLKNDYRKQEVPHMELYYRVSALGLFFFFESLHGFWFFLEMKYLK